MTNQLLINAINVLAEEVHQIAHNHGWWEHDRNNAEMIALMHSELSEALEGERHGNPPSEHIPNFSAVEEEFADTIIRILDYAQARNFDLGSALAAKIEFNRARPYKHGGKKF